MKLSVDIETFSEANLPKTGVYRYAEDPSFELLLFGVSVDGGPVRVYDVKQGEEIPESILNALQDSSVIKSSFNAMFERVCLSRYLWDLMKVSLLCVIFVILKSGIRSKVIVCSLLPDCIKIR